MLAVQDRDGSNAIVNEYTWGLNLGGGIGGLLHLAQNGQNYSYLYDGNGNVEAVLDASQQLAAAYRYDPFGNLLARSGSLTQPFGFSTKRSDAQTGLVHYQYRNYLPSMSRWTTRDPLGEAGGMNLYAFVGNNPVNWVDPWGLIGSWEAPAYASKPREPRRGGMILAEDAPSTPPNPEGVTGFSPAFKYGLLSLVVMCYFRIHIWSVLNCVTTPGGVASLSLCGSWRAIKT